MTRTALLAVLALLASPAWSQAAKAPADKPQAAKEAKPAIASADGRKSRRTEDARHCLEKSSNTEIIKCAEAFL